MSLAIQLRRAASGDAEAVWALYRACMRDSRVTCWYDGYPTRDILELDLENGWLYVYEDGGAIIGAVSLLPTDDLEEMSLPFECPENPCVLARLCLSPERQGRGEAAVLLRMAERHAAREGHPAVHLLCDQENPAARRLYDRAGYHAVADVALYGGRFHAFEKKAAQ